MKLYKLTDKDGYTRKGQSGETLWEPGKTLTIQSCENPQLCTEQVIHAYRNKNLALLLNPGHANIIAPAIWEATGDVCVEDWGKAACFSLTIEKEVRIPGWYTKPKTRHRVQVFFAVLCAEAVLKYFEDWNSKDDRPRKAIEAAREYLKNPSSSTAAAAARAARAAAEAAAAAARAAAAAAAAEAAAAAARAAAEAAEAAGGTPINFGFLADQAVKEIMKDKP